MMLLAAGASAEISFGWREMLAQGGIVLAVLGIMSVLVVAVALDRYFGLRLGQPRPEFMAGLRPFLDYGDRDRAVSYTSAKPGAISRTVRAGIAAWGEDREYVEEAMWRQRQIEVLGWENRLSWLGTIGSVAPFVGLFGTVLGIIHAFQALSRDQAGGPGVVAGGIAEALFTTAAGLLVAVPSVVLFNVFSRKLRVLRAELDSACSEATGWLVRLSPKSRDTRA